MDEAGINGMGRREFIGAAAAALFAGVAITLTGCDEEDKATTPTDGSKAGDVNTVSGHRHSVTITKAQLDAAAAVTLTLSTDSGHNHTVSLTADQVTALKGGTMINVASSENSGHTHTVHFM